MRHYQRLKLPTQLVTSCFFLFVLYGCRRSPAFDPAKAYEAARAELVQGRLRAAQEMAAAARERLQTNDPPWSFRFRILEADALSWQGLSQNVVDVLEKNETPSGPAQDLNVKRHLLLTLAYARLGQAQQADAELASAETGLEAAPAWRAEYLRTEGLLRNRRGQREAGIQLLRKSLALAHQDGDVFLEASDLSNLGFIALQAQHFDEAVDLFRASTHLANSIHADGIAQTNLGNSGDAYLELGDFAQALVSFEQAEVRARELGATDNMILWLQNQGQCLYSLGDLDGARTHYEQALQLAQSTHTSPRVPAAQTALGSLYLQLGDLGKAKQYADAALEGTRRAADAPGEADAILLRGIVAAREANADDARAILSPLYGRSTSLPSDRWQIENTYAQIFARQNQKTEAEAWFRRSIRTFEAQRASVQSLQGRLPFFANGDALYRDYADFLIANSRSDEALGILDGARSRTLEEGLGKAVKGASITGGGLRTDALGVARRLGGVILFYALGRQQSYLWAVNSQGRQVFTLPGEVEIADHIKRYQVKILNATDPLRDRNDDAQWLYRALVAPAEASLKPGDRVYLVRNGALNGFNFETLLKPGTSGLHYWIDDVQLTDASSVRLLDRASMYTGRQTGTRNLLLIGNPLPASAEYPALTSAASEMESVQRSFPVHTTTLTQKDAVPAAYPASHPEQYEYIHFVAHGTASRLLPLDSAIVLSPPPSQPEAFRLYARDILNQPLHAQLVTVSACYGSGLRDYAGEGLVGLSWAFLRAGAHRVIGALWAVDDASTAQLMDKLYQDLAARNPPDAALRNAKLSLLHSDGVYRKPLYWAAFQLYSGA